MARVIGDISISIDGFVTGPDDGPALGLGRGGEEIQTWVESPADADQQALDRASEAAAVIMGRHLFDVVDGPYGWREGMGYGADRDARPPLFVVTSEAPDAPRLRDLYPLTFVTDGLASAVRRASAAAGDGDVYVMGGGETVGGCLEAGLLDQLRLHVSPIVMGRGTPLFTGETRRILRQVDVAVSPVAVHVTYAVDA
ncbi:dihydrofolate reductase family protein [Agromyces sp. LHK192]|uniref:dihydrofolate reductase family protein n=1 Tax=Agromyces sp. LHK192 TaxID=2498704 RepID=UPI000FDB082D|nr:dihydrofolate reductase family protein [Agromyces sp. LHK192]